MLTRLAGGHVIDPANRRDAIGDIFIRDGRIVDAPAGGTVDESYDISNKIVMAGAIDIHSHIAGSNETMGRLVLPEQRISLGRLPPWSFSTAGGRLEYFRDRMRLRCHGLYDGG